MNNPDNSCCAHLTIKYQTDIDDDGFTHGWWECCFCKRLFEPLVKMLCDCPKGFFHYEDCEYHNEQECAICGETKDLELICVELANEVFAETYETRNGYPMLPANHWERIKQLTQDMIFKIDPIRFEQISGKSKPGA